MKIDPREEMLSHQKQKVIFFEHRLKFKNRFEIEHFLVLKFINIFFVLLSFQQVCII